jgi:cysteine synthase A
MCCPVRPANPNNWKAYYETTAPAILNQFPDLDVLFVGAGTTGTFPGCARFFRSRRDRVRIAAVDGVGSVPANGPRCWTSPMWMK